MIHEGGDAAGLPTLKNLRAVFGDVRKLLGTFIKMAHDLIFSKPMSGERKKFISQPPYPRIVNPWARESESVIFLLSISKTIMKK